MVDRSLRTRRARKGVTVAVSLAAALTLSLTGVSAASAASSPDRTSYAGSVPRWATAANDQGAAPDEETFIAADLDLARQTEIREQLPSLANRIPSAYTWPEEVTA